MMGNKSKVAPKSRLGRLRDEILFVRQFRYVTDLGTNDVQAIISELAYQPDGLTRVFFPRRRYVDLMQADDDTIQFTIKTKVGGLYTELTATGTIVYDVATRQTVVSGNIKFDAVYLAVLLTGLFMLITWGLASLSRAGITASPFIMFTLGLTNLFYFRQMFRDRDELLGTLADALTTSDLSEARQRLADSDIQAEVDTLTPSESHQSQEQS